ncbi:hypothetical protein AVEN_195257-1 [Araneus ventricosus]|uniref:Uncharacterized protein n=1 Tax=Araneus ventricosus TaxID=182803 RepID=A0A4Y2VDB3_ARAVE|nr:hypothetical protein AVEN_195257-1 [Araneus ventricosus]
MTTTPGLASPLRASAPHQRECILEPTDLAYTRPANTEVLRWNRVSNLQPLEPVPVIVSPRLPEENGPITFDQQPVIVSPRLPEENGPITFDQQPVIVSPRLPEESVVLPSGNRLGCRILRQGHARMIP